jgi:hypothetical protein|tara:strand:+ start:1664 stop:2233 length:570 start_codon:yes stop_codon:yes gene_type:complete
MKRKTTISISNNIVTKQYRKDLNNYFYNEITCLKLLEEKFDSTYFNFFSFPKILSIDEFNLSFTMTSCGEPVVNKFKIFIPNLFEQLQSIFFNLKNCNILYKDIHPYNICVNEAGNISLIDFEVAFLMNFEDYDNVLTFDKTLKKWSINFFENYYNKPEQLTIYNNLTLKSEKREWKGKPWSIAHMFTN